MMPLCRLRFSLSFAIHQIKPFVQDTSLVLTLKRFRIEGGYRTAGKLPGRQICGTGDFLGFCLAASSAFFARRRL